LVTKLAPTEYVIVTVPAATPVTKPVEVTVATDGLLLLHVPPGVASLSNVDAPTQVDELPVIGAMLLDGVTVKVLTTEHPETV
jgi:hypothetical protein